jgi:hypothetical protein
VRTLRRTRTRTVHPDLFLSSIRNLLDLYVAQHQCGGISTDVSGELLVVVSFDQRLMNLLRSAVIGEGIEGA